MNSMEKIKSIFCVGFLSLVFLHTGHSQEISKELLVDIAQERQWRLSLGAGLILKKNMRVGNTYENMDKKILTKLIPYVTGSYKRLSLGPQGLALRILGNPFVHFSTFLNRAGDKYQGVNMAPRKESVFFGISGKIAKFNLSLSRDINGRSKGVLSQFSYGQMSLISEDLILRTSFNIEWHDDRYAEYFFGVKGQEVSSSRKEYHVKNFFQPGISFMPIYKLRDHLSFVGVLGFKLIPKSIRNSPTMNGRGIESFGLMAINYSL